MSEPMYRLIADDLRRQIESGALRPGVQLQSEVELREKYGQGQDGGRRGTLSATQSSSWSPADWWRPARDRAPSW